MPVFLLKNAVGMQNPFGGGLPSFLGRPAASWIN
jgi:hypothetical protein